jgi:hypothetical protein
VNGDTRVRDFRHTSRAAAVDGSARASAGAVDSDGHGVTEAQAWGDLATASSRAAQMSTPGYRENFYRHGAASHFEGSGRSTASGTSENAWAMGAGVGHTAAGSTRRALPFARARLAGTGRVDAEGNFADSEGEVTGGDVRARAIGAAAGARIRGPGAIEARVHVVTAEDRWVDRGGRGRDAHRTPDGHPVPTMGATVTVGEGGQGEVHAGLGAQPGREHARFRAGARVPSMRAAAAAAGLGRTR